MASRIISELGLSCVMLMNDEVEALRNMWVNKLWNSHMMEYYYIAGFLNLNTIDISGFVVGNVLCIVGWLATTFLPLPLVTNRKCLWTLPNVPKGQNHSWLTITAMQQWEGTNSNHTQTIQPYAWLSQTQPGAKDAIHRRVYNTQCHLQEVQNQAKLMGCLPWERMLVTGRGFWDSGSILFLNLGVG